MRGKRTLLLASLGMAALATWLFGSGQVRPNRYNPVINPANFTTKIDNPFFPLKPGTIYTFKGVTDAGEELNTVEVTHSTRDLMGVTCVEVVDTVFVNNVLEELTLDWFAQDKQGNVWYFGEDARQFSNGVQTGAEGSWLAGVDGGLPGIVMEAHPKVGDLYRQEFLRHVAEDMAEVLSLNGFADVPYGSFQDCVVTKDFSPLEKKVVENKWYASGIGVVKSITVKGGLDTSELVSITHKDM